MGESVSLAAAALAGLVSFVSPCVLPIVPGYLSFISGVNLAQLRGAEAPPGVTRRVALTSLFFVLGFSTVFVALGAYVVGLAFAFGWTPCIGPILGAILLYASQQETVAQGVLLLAAYSAGLGIPFIVAGLAVNGFFRVFGRLRGSMRTIEVVSGALLVGVGLLLVTDRLTLLAQYFAKAFPGLVTLG